MVSINALQQCLPVTGLEPQLVAFVQAVSDIPDDLRWERSIRLFEPPAGQRVPYLEPVHSLALLLVHQGAELDAALARAAKEYEAIRNRLSAQYRVHFYDDLEPNPAEQIPAPLFLQWLHDLACIPSETLGHLDRIVTEVVQAPIMEGPDNWKAPWSLAQLPAATPPKAMIEFFPGPSWIDYSPEEEQAFAVWREAIRPVAERLADRLGEPVYYFADPENDLDDDNVHRFLVLHWCCTFKPASAYVQYLLASSGARDLGAFKAALTAPESYRHPFKMNDAFWWFDCKACRFSL